MPDRPTESFAKLARERFEEWAIRQFVRIPVGDNPIQATPDGRYVGSCVQAAWLAWQAAQPTPEQGRVERILRSALDDSLPWMQDGPLWKERAEIAEAKLGVIPEQMAQAARKIAAIYGFPQHHEEALQILNDTFKG